MSHIELDSRARVRRARRLAGAAALAALALAACNRGDAADADSAGTPVPVTVGAENVAVVAQDTIETGPAVSGTLTAEREAQVRAEAGGTVLRVLAEAGQRVTAGQLLAQIEQKAAGDAVLSARTAVSAARTAYETAKREADRAQTLLKAGAIAERDAESAQRAAELAESQLATARAQLASAEQALASTRVTAPFAGVVSDRAVSAGDVVTPGAELFTVVDPSSMRYEASVPAEALSAVRVGAPVHFTVSGYPGRSFEGHVTRVNPTADPTTRQVRLIVSVPNAGGQLVGGLYAEGRVASERQPALVAPASAVDERGVTPAVYRLKNGVVERVPVEIALRDPQSERVALNGNLAAGDMLLTGAAQGITPGTPVRIGTPTDTGRTSRPVPE
ncbi:MAG TPA: efflux RND transporter periplasmic adaptor subunit [Gemmatimonadaceae bacterium]|nr:efflux RND transporter periplasmic adaptor subunit [Gemmatimonadaceae bacterium]